MFFLLRMAFLCLVVMLVLVPFGLKGQDGKDVSVFDALGALQAVVADARGFCDRQPDVCAVGGQLATNVKHKAQTGFRWVYEMSGGAPATTGSLPPAPPAALDAAPAQRSSLPPGLTPADMAPAWGGGAHVQPVLPPSMPAAAPEAPKPSRRPT